LLSLIEKSNNPEMRRDCILFFQKLGVHPDKSEQIYKIFESCLLSDENHFVRASAAQLIAEKFLKYGSSALQWAIKHDTSPTLIKSLYDIASKEKTGTFFEIKTAISEWIQNYAKKLDIIPLEAPFFLDVECLFSNALKIYAISEDSFEYFRALRKIGVPKPWISIKEKHVEALTYNYYNWVYIKNNQDIITSFMRINDLDSFFLLHQKYDDIDRSPPLIPDSIGLLTKLKSLRLSSNSIIDIPKFIPSLSLLSELDLSKNHIEKLPDSIKQIKRLKILNLKNNYVREIPSDLKEFLSTLDTFRY
jgi:hypothetical protein